MTIPSSRSLIFEVKSTGSELAFIRVLRLRKTSDFFGRLRTSSGIFRNDRVVFKNPSTPRIKISRLYLKKSWQVYNHNAFVVRTRTWLVCYLVRKSMNFAHFAGFSGIIIRGPNRSEIDCHLCRWDERIRRNPSQNAAFFTGASKW